MFLLCEMARTHDWQKMTSEFGKTCRSTLCAETLKLPNSMNPKIHSFKIVKSMTKFFSVNEFLSWKPNISFCHSSLSEESRVDIYIRQTSKSTAVFIVDELHNLLRMLLAKFPMIEDLTPAQLYKDNQEKNKSLENFVCVGK